MKNILVIGAAGQIGSELVPYLREKYGKDNVIATGRKTKLPPILKEGPTHYLDVLKGDALDKMIFEYEIDTIYHMASILSATGEKMPMVAWDINLNGLIKVLEAGKKHKIERIIWPSSIAAFGPTTPRDDTPDLTVLEPSTMYGITKVAGELLISYYWEKFGVDTRSVRLPGIISNVTEPGGGTTDYAVAIYYEALKQKKYESFLSAETALPMMYMPDCLEGLLQIAEANVSNFTRRTYNMGSMSFTPEDMKESIKKFIPEFELTYKTDFRQAIADSWPRSLNDSIARKDWNWDPKYNLDKMTEDMLEKLKAKGIK